MKDEVVLKRVHTVDLLVTIIYMCTCTGIQDQCAWLHVHVCEWKLVASITHVM